MKLQASRTNSLNLPVMHHFLIILFIFLTSLNLLGLFPYVFSATSHLILTLSFGLPLWLMLIISSIAAAPSSTAAGLLPAGAPSWLNPFLVIIETISTGVQPGTLSFRLAANMSAGHIVMTLLSIYLMVTFWLSSWKAFGLLLVIQVFYFMFEAGIAMVQAYIFCLLLSLYSDAHPLT
uniref:ATP synthase subunit a n=1 Tax=Phascolosoma sp. MZK-2017 TaxID=1979532 RepID=A0A1W5YQB9_9ANNE|nr:ATP synthase F0 subunit 6 [Phascolosoma sp. MZK-2017]